MTIGKPGAFIMGDSLVDRLRAVREPAKRPTIAELEAILAQPEPPPVVINPDGSISASKLINPDGPEAANVITALEGALVAIKLRHGWCKARCKACEQAAAALSLLRGGSDA